MNDIIIKKVSTNMIDFVEVNGTLDIKNKKMNFNLVPKDYNKLFPVDPKINPSNLDFFIIDNDENKYSCIGCVTGLDFNSTIKIKVVNINLIFENIITTDKNILTNYIEFETTYPKHYLYGRYINDFNIKYTQTKTIRIKKTVDEEYTKINISINSKKNVKREKLDDVLYAILEITYLIFGSIPHLKKYKFKYDGTDIVVHFDLADKYIQNQKSGSNDDALSVIDETVLTKDLIKKFQKFRKNTSILFDMLLINANGKNYVEIKNCLLIQLIEGTYRTLNPGTKKKLWEILEYYFIKSSATNMILNKKDLKSAKDIHNTPIFLYKAKQHRHYLSHLNMNDKKDFFYKLENNYAWFKLILCLRLIYMDQLGIAYNKVMLNKIIKSINDWGAKNKIKI